MQQLPINYLALIVAAVVKVVLAAIWFNIPFNAKAWATATGSTPADMKKRMPLGIVSDLIASFVMAWVLAHAIGYAGAKDIGSGLAVGFFNWLGFGLAIQFTGLIWDKRNPGYFWSSQVFLLIAFLAMSAIIVGWT